MSAIELRHTYLFYDPSLVAYYQLEDLTDSEASFDLTNNNTVAFNAGLFNNAADFSATNTNKYLNVDSNLSAFSGNITIILNVKLQAEIGSGQYDFLNLGDLTTQSVFQIGYEYNGGTRRLYWDRTRRGVANDRIYQNGALGTTNYVQMVLTYDTSGTPTVEGYMNGLSIGTVSSSGNGNTGGADKLTLGCGWSNLNAAVNFSSVIIDDVAIFTRKLTATEISNLYNGTIEGASTSASVSPSASISPSPSVSVSSSLSPSPSVSISLSQSTTPSASISPSPSTSSSQSPSLSISISISASPSVGYTVDTRGDELTLPLTIDDLENVYTEVEEDYISVRDNHHVSQTGVLQYMIHQFKRFVPSTYCNIEWEGKSDLSCGESPIYLQVFNHSTNVWETVDSDTITPEGIDLELSYKISDTSDYRDNNIISCRVWQLAT